MTDTNSNESESMSDTVEDTWSAWLDDQRFSGGEQEERVKNSLHEYRETVLDHAEISEDDTVLDVGAGNGLIAFGALDRLGPEGKAIFCDISEDVLERARTTAEELGVLDRCEFVVATAEDLEPIENESVDVVTLRSVLIYVEEKKRAFSEFHRVLKPGGRLSIFEPIGKFTHQMEGPDEMFFNYDMGRIDLDLETVQPFAEQIAEYGWQEQSIDTEPALDFNERDLFSYIEQTGFEDIYLDLSAQNTVSYETEEWESWLTKSFGPGAPTRKEAMEEVLTPEERETFIEYAKPLVESRKPVDLRGTTAYLWAKKPDR